MRHRDNRFSDGTAGLTVRSRVFKRVCVRDPVLCLAADPKHYVLPVYLRYPWSARGLHSISVQYRIPPSLAYHAQYSTHSSEETRILTDHLQFCFCRSHLSCAWHQHLVVGRDGQPRRQNRPLREPSPTSHTLCHHLPMSHCLQLHRNMAVRVSQNTKATAWVNNVYPEFKDYAFQLQVPLI